MREKAANLMIVREVAFQLRTTPATVQRLIHAGELAAFRIGVKRAYRVDTRVLAKFLASRKIEVATPGQPRLSATGEGNDQTSSPTLPNPKQKAKPAPTPAAPAH